MPRLTPDQWEQARALRESGSNLTEVAERMGVDRAAVSRRAKAEGWGDGTDLADAVRRKVTEKTHGIVTTGDAKKRAAALDAAADRVVEVVRRHQQEWADHRARFGSVPEDFEAGKHAKISSEMLLIRQKGERAAHGLDEAESKPDIVIRWRGAMLGADA